ncbi:MAG: YidC/Oxa1 family membrane protein insertase [Oscillospiraceae bacterium]|jgi:YidC/Oxa1 family membrane protein insertase|nr:YidC/Oxa1 family membrane protein insertase [Oscillospiraceae bacterium]MCI1989878.1 YidC/Oxa1 family membrane protein insertase [Oscillospiraceae bacterium]
MNDIFNFFGSILGYLLWWLYVLVKNYGVAIVLFTVIIKLLLFPFSVKQQRSMASTAKLSLKQKELQKKYAKDKQKLQIETQKLYEKEGVNPTGGCTTMLFPFLVMFGLYYTVLNPLSNALHLSSGAITKAVDMLNHVPGMGNTFNAQYAQIEIVKNFSTLKPYLTMFGTDELGRLESFSHGFKFLGLNLLDTPCDPSNIFGTLFRSNLWVIPVLCLVTYILTQYFTFKLQPGMQQQQQQGCMKGMFYIMAFVSAWFACTVPAAVGSYWIISSITQFFQTIVLNVWYSPADLNAEAEARHVALREQEEAAVKPLPVNMRRAPAAQKKTTKTEKRRR